MSQYSKALRRSNIKQYFVFAGDYGPLGGWDDFQKSFIAFYDAKKFAKRIACEHSWVQVIHLESEKPMFSIFESREREHESIQQSTRESDGAEVPE